MRQSQTAFSLLEILIALTILSLSGFALFDLLNTRLINYQQQQQASRHLQQQQALLALATTLNPVTMDKDSDFRKPQTLGALQWNWEATAIEEQDTAGYKSGLYNVYLQPDDPEAVLTDDSGLRLLKMGYQLKQ